MGPDTDIVISVKDLATWGFMLGGAIVGWLKLRNAVNNMEVRVAKLEDEFEQNNKEDVKLTGRVIALESKDHA